MERTSIKISLLKIGLSNIRLPQTLLAFHQTRSVEIKKPTLKQENGFGFRLENGKSLLLEKDGTKTFEIIPPKVPSGIILESNKNTLLESGSSIKQENNNTNMEDKDLKISELIPAMQLDGREIIPFAKDDANGSLLVSLLKAYIIDGLAKQSAVDGKQNRLIAGYGIEITPENKIQSTLDVSLFKIVDVLPTADIENKIYLVLDSESKSDNNEYLEYLYVNGKWEMVGKYYAKVDLSEYMKSAEADVLYARKTQIPDVSDFITNAQLNIVLERLAQLEAKMTIATTKLATIPAIPANDQCSYAIQNGQWTEIAGADEAVVTMTTDAPVQTTND